MKQAFYAVRTVGVLAFRWAKAKLTGKPYDSGMD